jgi:hypothetical protein
MFKHWIIVAGVQAGKHRAGVSFDSVASMRFEIVKAGLITGSILPPAMSAPLRRDSEQRLDFKLIEVIGGEYDPYTLKVDHRSPTG